MSDIVEKSLEKSLEKSPKKSSKNDATNEIDPTLTANDMKAVIYSEINRKGIAGHHIESMNEFYSSGMEQIIRKIYKIEFRMKNERDNTDEDRSISEISASVVVTKVEPKKPTQVLYKSGMEVPLFPQTAREQGLTYGGDIFIDADINATAIINDGTTKTLSSSINNHRIGAIPIMLYSDLCNITPLSKETLESLGEDPNGLGGCFIINGTTWVVNNLEGVTYNAYHVQNEHYKKELARGMFISKAGDTFENSYQHILRYMSNGAITFDIITNRGQNLEIPFFLLFRALGMTSDKDIVDHIVYGVDNLNPVSNEIIKIVKMAYEAPMDEYESMRSVVNPDEIVNFLGRKLITVENENAVKNNDEIIKYINKQFLSLVDKNILSHIGTEASFRGKKLEFLAHLINELISVHLGILEPTDRDSLKNKRISTAGISIAKSFKQLYNFSICKEIIKHLKKEFKSTTFSSVNLAETVKNSIKPDELERLLSQSITTGNKTMIVKRNEVKNRISSQSVSTPKNDIYLKAVLGTISAPNFSKSKQTERADVMRRVHKSFIGFIDPSMSPDTGELVGMNKQMACTASIGAGTSSFTLKRILRDDKDIMQNVVPFDINKYSLAKVFVNGDWVGCTKNAYDIVRKYRLMRRAGEIHRRTTIVWEPLVRKVLFLVDVGRMHRPLIIVYNNIAECIENYRNGDKTAKFKQWVKLTKEHIHGLQSKKLSNVDLENEGILEYITPEEQENTYIAPNIDELRKNKGDLHYIYTHCDIDQAIFGLITLASPLANYSNATRITYFTNHRKQSAGWFAMNYPHSIQKNTMMQWYNERPLVSTLVDGMTYPTGHNPVMEIATIEGVCQEDSLIICQTAVDCGLYNASYYTFEKSELEKDEEFGVIDKFKTKDINSNANYEHIGSDGAIRVGALVRKGTVLISKMLKLSKPIKNYTYVDRSTIYMGVEDMRVEKVVFGKNENNSKFIKIKLRSVRNLALGDKMSSRTGNKGIFSKRESRINMNYTVDGMRCSGVGGPHSFPSRMALNQLIEGALAQRACKEGAFAEGTTFQDVNIADLSAFFDKEAKKEKYGSNRLGSHKVMNGKTNEWMDNDVFIGPCYMLRLQKFAIDSQYAMYDGPTTSLTHQPLEGRANGGGLRFGEMESWVYVAQGAMRSLGEKFYLDSDGHTIPVCRGCGDIAIVNKKLGIYRCDTCGDNVSIGEVSSSWCVNLLIKEAQAMNSRLSLGLEPYTFERKMRDLLIANKDSIV
jgi:DNA-directed RNA polymerase II subunit RPB2